MADALLAFRQAGVTELYGNLLTVPVGNGLLYVQPIYTQRESASGTGTYPQLQFVLASFGDQRGDRADPGGGARRRAGHGDGGAGGPGRQRGAAATDSRRPTTSRPVRPTTPPSCWSGPTGCYEQATAALDAQDLGEYQRLVEKSNALVARALDLLGQEAPADGGGSAPVRRGGHARPTRGPSGLRRAARP